MKKIVYRCFIVLVFLGFVFAQNNETEKKEFVTLHLVLDDGFLPGEWIKIHVINKQGEKEVFSGPLIERLNHQDENFFEIQIDKGTYNLLKVISPARGTEASHGFIVNQDVYIELHVSLKNEFLFITVDSLWGYD